MGISLAICLLFTNACDVFIGKRSPSCAGWNPIYLEEGDHQVISDELSRQILSHNMQGDKLCKWASE